MQHTHGLHTPDDQPYWLLSHGACAMPRMLSAASLHWHMQKLPYKALFFPSQCCCLEVGAEGPPALIPLQPRLGMFLHFPAWCSSEPFNQHFPAAVMFLHTTSNFLPPFTSTFHYSAKKSNTEFLFRKGQLSWTFPWPQHSLFPHLPAACLSLPPSTPPSGEAIPSHCGTAAGPDLILLTERGEMPLNQGCCPGHWHRLPRAVGAPSL